MPKLCATDTLKAFGSCRVCLVEIEGRKGFPASCTTEVAAGMKVRTHSEALTKTAPRRARAVCLRASDGQLPGQPAAASSRHWPASMASPSRASRARRPRATCTRHKPVDASNPYFRFDNDSVHRLLALRARLRGNAGHVRADHRGPRPRIARRRLAGAALPRIRVRVLRRLRRSLSHRRADGEVASSPRACRSRRSPPPARIAAWVAR